MTNPKTNICHILYTGLSGVGDVALNFVTGDIDRQCDHSMLFVGVEPLLPYYSEFCARHDVRFNVLRTLPKLSELYGARIAARISRLKPDIVISHGGIPGITGALLSRVPTIFVEHHSVALRNRRDDVATWCAARFAAGIVTLTEGYRTHLVETFGTVMADKVTVIPNGVDITSFTAKNIARRADSVTIGMAARLHDSKRFDVLIDMLGDLRRRRPSIDWNLSLAGDGPSRAALVKKVHDMDLAGSVLFAGMVDKADLPGWFRDIDIYAHASEGETLSMALLQAMATQLPIIGSDVPGIRESLGGREPPGLLASAQSGAAFADAVLALLDNPGETARMSRAGYDRVRASNSNRAMFDSYLRLIHRVQAA